MGFIGEARIVGRRLFGDDFNQFQYGISINVFIFIFMFWLEGAKTCGICYFIIVGFCWVWNFRCVCLSYNSLNMVHNKSFAYELNVLNLGWVRYWSYCPLLLCDYITCKLHIFVWFCLLRYSSGELWINRFIKSSW